jgi:hypothetical protein
MRDEVSDCFEHAFDLMKFSLGENKAELMLSKLYRTSRKRLVAIIQDYSSFQRIELCLCQWITHSHMIFFFFVSFGRNNLVIKLSV